MPDDEGVDMSGVSGFARVWAAIAGVLTLVLTVTVWLLFTGGYADSASPPAEGDAPAALAVTLTEFAIEPETLTAPAGVPLVVEVTNEGGVPHDFAIDGVGETPLLQSGETATLETGPLAAGDYAVLCTVAGHEGAGMHATLTVADDGDPGSPEAHEAHGATAEEMTAEEMAAKHDDLSAFPADTEGRGNQPLEPEVDDDGTLVFDLTAEEIEWETEPGVTKAGMAFNGQVPGPRLDIDLGDDVRIVLHNEMTVPTSLHLHGLVLPNEMDGVPGLTQDSVLPGDSFTYEFTARNAGSHMYHSHFDSARQVPSGLLGALIVHDPDDPEVDVDYVMILNDGPLGYTLNGKGFPATEPVVVERGQRVRVRYMNEGLEIHPMHLHGMPQRVVAKDGYPLDAPYTADNILVSPGDRVDVIVDATEPGSWAWHCHILTHAEGPDGMFGMVTALIVEE
ncbi:MAG: multicopper oxidase domain-containing protein [Egibacteraceae bacterium]